MFITTEAKRGFHGTLGTPPGSATAGGRLMLTDANNINSYIIDWGNQAQPRMQQNKAGPIKRSDSERSHL